MSSSRPTRIFIGHIPQRCTERDLERFFKSYGRIKDVILKSGYGFVEFEDERDAEDAAHELNGKYLLGKVVTVEQARGVARRGAPNRDQYQYQNQNQYSYQRGGNRGGSGVKRICLCLEFTRYLVYGTIVSQRRSVPSMYLKISGRYPMPG